MNYKYTILIILIISSIINLSSCKKEDDDPIDINMGYEYYPIELGTWYIYSVDSTVYNENYDSIYTHSYQVKEMYADTFTDGEGRLSYVIDRYKRSNDSASWEKSDVWHITKTEVHIERVEENVSYEPFIFPVNTNYEEWDLNTYNSYNIYSVWSHEQNDKIMLKDTLVGQAFSLDSTFSYSNTVTVWHEYVTAINYTLYHAVYVKDVGLVYKHMIYFDTDNTNLIVTEGKFGVDYTQKLVSYGN
jgi:hypothetical protein